MMELGQIISLIVVVIANLTTVITLYLHLDNKTGITLEAIRQDSKTFQKAMLDELKDFHGRLCAIEERGKK